MSSSNMELVELRVPLRCEACERNVRKALSRMIGVESVEVDIKNQKVTVMGYVDPDKVARKVKRAMIFAQIWPFSLQHHHRHRQNHHGNYDEYHSHHTKHQGSSSRQHHNRNSVDFWPSNYVDVHGDTSVQNVYAPYEDLTHHIKHDDRSHGSAYKHEEYYRRPKDDKVTTMFSDENVNSCSIM